MDHSKPPYRSPMAWPALIFSALSLCFSLWVTIYRSPPLGFLARYGVVFLGVSMVTGTTASSGAQSIMTGIAVMPVISFASLARNSVWPGSAKPER